MTRIVLAFYIVKLVYDYKKDFEFTTSNTIERTKDDLPTESETINKEGFVILDQFKPKTT